MAIFNHSKRIRDGANMIRWYSSLFVSHYARISKKLAPNLRRTSGTTRRPLCFAASTLRDAVFMHLKNFASNIYVYKVTKIRTQSVQVKGKTRGHSIKYDDQVHQRRRRIDRSTERQMESTDQSGNDQAQCWASIVFGQTC